MPEHRKAFKSHYGELRTFRRGDACLWGRGRKVITNKKPVEDLGVLSGHLRLVKYWQTVE